MFKPDVLVYNKFFGFGIIISCANDITEVFFEDGPRKISNTHLIEVNDKFEYEKIKKKMDDLLRKKEEMLLESQINSKKKTLDASRTNEIKNVNQQPLKRFNSYIEDYSKSKKYIQFNKNLDRLFNHIKQPIYNIKDFYSLLNLYNIPITENILEYALWYLGFRKKAKGVILNNEWSSIVQYFEHEVTRSEKYYYNNRYNIEIYDDIIKRLEKKMVLFEASPGVYVTKKLMVKLGINTDTLNHFYNIVIMHGRKNLFFSAKNIMDIFQKNEIVKFSYNENQLEKFILSTPGIKSIQTDDLRHVFSFTSDRFTISFFVSKIVSSLESIDIYELRDFILDKYKVDFGIDSIIYAINNSNLFYSEEMDKIYKNKETFIMEVFYESE